MQFSLAQVLELNVLGMSVLRLKQQMLSLLHQVLIYETAVLPQLYQFWDTIQSELANKSPYIMNIEGMKMKVFKL